ncbi:Cthe_2314 family HEPN domain-containing protein [Wenyingzhuangia sp. IMCC45467]
MKEITFKKKLGNLSSEFIIKNDDKYKPTNKDNFLIESFLAVAEIDIVLEQLYQTPYFLSSFRQTEKLKKNGIYRFEHIIYHIENYLFRTTGIMDRLLIFLNILLETNLKPRDCKPYNFLINKNGTEGKCAEKIKLKSPELFFELNLLNSFIDTFREIRNEITHQKRFNTEDLKKIELLNIVSKDSTISNEKYTLKRETDKIVFKYRDLMLKNNNEIEIQLNKIYKILDLVWSEVYKNK